MPQPIVALPCGSRSISRQRRFVAASEAVRLTAVVVLPTPPFWLATAMMRFMSAREYHPVPRSRARHMPADRSAIHGGGTGADTHFQRHAVVVDHSIRRRTVEADPAPGPHDHDAKRPPLE